MKALFFFVTVCFAMAHAFAQDLVELRNPQDWSCSEIREFVRQQGRVLVYQPARFAPVTLYTFVYPKQCPGKPQFSRPHLVPSSDRDDCIAGVRCSAAR